MALPDLYSVLGVPEDASVETIKTVYRQLARTFHPDVNADDGAVEHFREITEAFVVLSDPEKRKAYDRLRRRKPRRAGHETETYLGLRVAGIDLGSLLGVSVRVRRSTLVPDEPDPGEQSSPRRRASEQSSPPGPSRRPALKGRR